MTQFDRFERELPVALNDVVGQRTPDYLTDILGRTARTRQRPAWASLERWLPMDIATTRVSTTRIPWRIVGVLALILLLLAAGVTMFATSHRQVPPPFGPARNGLIPYDAGGDIFVGDPVAGTSRLLVGGPEDDHDPTFSPDGTQIGFVREAANGADIIVGRADGGDVRKITSSPLVNLTIAGWVPTSDGMYVGSDVDGRQALEILDASGRSSARTIAEGLSIDALAFRPPDGREILFRGLVGGQWGLYTMKPDGTGIRQLAASNVYGPPDQDLNSATYSPDGSRIYYNRYTPEAFTIQLWVMNADGTGQRLFNQDPHATWEGEGVPSPDGRWVAFWPVFPTQSTQRIAVIGADGSGAAVQTGPELTGTADWMWSPDSTKLLMKSNDSTGGQSQLLLDPAGGPWTTPAWTALTEPDWQRVAP